MNKPILSIVIPTYNEKDNISKILRLLRLALGDVQHEIIFVDDNSPDGTANEVKISMRKFSNLHLIHRIGRRGLSGAIIEGVFAAKSEIVAVMDCDLQHDESKLLEMIALFSNSASLDLVIGSRFTEDGEISDKAFSSLKAPIKMITPPHTPVPFSPALEDLYLPSADNIKKTISNILN